MLYDDWLKRCGNGSFHISQFLTLFDVHFCLAANKNHFDELNLCCMRAYHAPSPRTPKT